jgi:lon-related putative ATP-dependent protease
VKEIEDLPVRITQDKYLVPCQARASRALELGVTINSPGFNIYVAGIPGTGKLSSAQLFAARLASQRPVPSDWCYVNNFKDPYQPIRLNLPAGQATVLKRDMKSLIREALQNLVRAFESVEYADRRKKITESFDVQQATVMEELRDRAQQESFVIKQTPWEIIAIPMVNGHPMTDQQFEKLSSEEQQMWRGKQDKFLEEIKSRMEELRKREREVNRALGQLEQDIAVITISSLTREIADKYQQLPEVLAYLQEVKNDILENLGEFLVVQKGPGGTQHENPFQKRYEINILVDNSGLKGAPVIIEKNPGYNNLVGRVEKESFMGNLVTDFTMIRKGSLHSANGGYLVIRVEELLQNYLSWNGLKRALKNRQVEIEDPGEQLGLMTTRTVKPQPIPLDVKVILVGHPVYYYLLYAYDPDFRELFKVKADFDSEMDRSNESITNYGVFIRSLCGREKILPLDQSAMAKIVEHGSRLVSDQYKLSACFSTIGDIAREANHYAREEGSQGITGQHVARAIGEKYYRSNLVQEKINELIGSGQVLIDLKGEKTGQVNGLAVIELGDFSIGRPNRITCSVSLGKEGVVAIEREAEMSGPIHTKGVLILSGYLAEKYMQQKPASLAARLVFEQSYAEIEGDSASSAELYAILSSLSGLPIRQGIAVTGSVNQKGEVQSIGGVNEKIEGYFEICKQAGFSGEQGVMIPAANCRNLMLKEEVVNAVEKGQFNIWAVDTIDDGIEILTGVRPGPVTEAGTVAYRVNETLNEYANRMKEFAKGNVKLQQKLPEAAHLP